MNYEFTGRHVQVTPALERLVKKELGKLDRILDSAPMTAHVILTEEKHRKTAEILIYWRDSVFKGIAQNTDFSQAIILAAAKAEKQVLRLKEKFQTQKRGRTPVKAAAPVPGGVLEPAPAAPRIVRTPRYRIKPMTPGDAAVLLADSDDQFVVFRDAETERISVLYHRKDGNYGLIET